MATPNYLELEELVKYCVLDGAIINGNDIESCIGKISEEVRYNDVTITVNTEITSEDIAAYHSIKASEGKYCI